MKKVIISLITFVLLWVTPIYAADIKWYSDWKNGYCGYAGADYIGTTKNIDPNAYANNAEAHLRSLGVYITRYCQKISKQENYLLWSALSMYNYSDGEVYAVTIQQGKEILNLFVVIKDGGKSCSQYGGWYILDPT